MPAATGTISRRSLYRRRSNRADLMNLLIWRFVDLVTGLFHCFMSFIGLFDDCMTMRADMQATAMGAAVMLGAIVVLARTPESPSVIAQAAPSTPIPLAPPAL